MKINTVVTAVTVALATTAGTSGAADWAPTSVSLMTRWAKDVSPDKVWPEYPRPQLTRDKWQNLNGLWDVALGENARAETPNFDKKILVPFPVESALSGVGERADHVVYRRQLEVPADWKGQRVLLHFDAVDWQTSVSLNGTTLKTLEGDETHKGGYDRFSYDITDALKDGGPNELMVSVFDPSDKGDQPRGKQVVEPNGIWYTPSTGIWQTVWLEPVSPKGSIQQVRFTPNAAKGTVNIKTQALGASGESEVEISIFAGEAKQAVITAAPGEEVEFTLENPRLWSPEDPFLYDVQVRLLADKAPVDSVKSYFGLRDIEMKKVGDYQRVFLNGKEIFQSGTLDQGFWPEGLHTPPTHEAMVWDIDYTRQMGFNMIRKHIKIEPDLWYHHCDKTGMLVWQDAVSGENKSPESHRLFEKDLHRMIDNHWSSPAIVLWVVFNEGWGQYDTERITQEIQTKDPTRLVTSPSGWVDKGVGDIQDMHKYPGPGAPLPDPKRASVLGEFGGLGLFVKGHSWSEKHWGYQGMATKEELAQRFAGIMNGLKFLRATRGLCASVYTQTTDVEIEANGLVSYDREVKKLDTETVRGINESIINMADLKVLAPTALQDPAPQWKYTTDKPADDWATTEFKVDDWKTSASGFGDLTKRIFGKVGTEWKTPDIWIRREFDLPADVNTENVQLMIVHAKDAEVYINGVLTAELKDWVSGYTPVNLTPGAIASLRPGQKNTIAIHCHSTEVVQQGTQVQKDVGQFIDAGLVEVTQ